MWANAQPDGRPVIKKNLGQLLESLPTSSKTQTRNKGNPSENIEGTNLKFKTLNI